jgi:glycosyltransferase involved in cell wall biosynthesis
MIYLGYFILIFTTLQFLVAAVNLIFLQRYPKTMNPYSGLVSVLIPARNEEKNIGTLLDNLQNQNYQNIEIFVFNDQSTDQTAEVVNNFAQRNNRIKLINSEGLPKGWLGKNFACYKLASKATGDYLLFLDADVRVAGSIIQDTTNLSEKHNLGLLSIFPMQKMENLGERMTVPNMNYILLSLLPLVLVRKTKFPSLAAANGQFMLFNAKTYRKNAPHKQVKNSKVEDIEIARWYKQNHIKVACLVGNPFITCRMYKGFSDAVYGFSKNVIQFFGDSFVLAILFWLITTFGFIVVLLQFSIALFVAYIGLTVLTRIFISTASRQAVLRNLILAVPQQITMGLFIFQAIKNTFKKEYIWKDRKISS